MTNTGRANARRYFMSHCDPFLPSMEGAVARLILNRPEKRNRMGLAFFSELERHFRELDENPDVRGFGTWRRKTPSLFLPKI